DPPADDADHDDEEAERAIQTGTTDIADAERLEMPAQIGQEESGEDDYEDAIARRVAAQDARRHETGEKRPERQIDDGENACLDGSRPKGEDAGGDPETSQHAEAPAAHWRHAGPVRHCREQETGQGGG